MNFPDSREKVKRAVKHVNDLNELLTDFSASNFYSVSVQEQEGSNIISIAVFRHFPTTTAALIIGDTLHNLRSALDLLYYKIFDEVTGKADKFTRFPIRDRQQELISSIDGGLKKKRLSDHLGAIALRDFIVNVIKPYKAGNDSLWALHEMNITDKHQLLIPTFKIMRFADISLQDEKGDIFPADGLPYFLDDSYWFKLNRTGNFTIHQKGNAATAIVFGIGVPLQDKPVIPALNTLADNLTRTIDAFEGVNLEDWRR
jgi:hypothetical protein